MAVDDGNDSNNLENKGNFRLKKREKWAVLFFVLAAVSWYAFLFESRSNLGLVFLDLCTALTILSAGFFFICLCARIAEKRGKKSSPHRVFAIVDIVIGLFITAYAIGDIASEWFQGLIGIFLLIFIIPIVILLLAVDYILYVLQKKQEE